MGLRAKFTQGAAPEGATQPSAEPQTEESIGEELAEELGDDVPSDIRALADKKLRHKMGVRREIKHLPQLLGEGESVLNLAAGRYDGHQGLIVATDRRLFFLEKGLARSRQEDFPYSKLSSIQTNTGMVFGKLVIFVSGNKAIIDQVVPKERVNELGDYVRARISDAPTAPAQIPATAPTPGEDPEHRLRRVQRMLDDGLLSPDEFEERRRVILADL